MKILDGLGTGICKNGTPIVCATTMSSGNVPKEAIAELFEAQAERASTAVAAVCGTESLSYCELNRQANLLAHQLIAMGIGPEMLVGLCMDRSLEMIVGLMAIFKAGAAYLPLDPNHPQARIRTLLNEAVPKVTLSSSIASERLPDVFPVIKLDQWLAAEHKERQTHNPTDEERISILHSAHPAYVIYTSGTTGIPKGVVITYAGIANKIISLNQYLNVTEEARYGVTASINTDPLLEQILCPLCTGAVAVIVPEQVRMDGAAFARYIENHQVSIIDATPKLLETLLFNGNVPTGLEYLLVGGEVFTAELANLLQKMDVARHIVNIYGPTETCIDATVYELAPQNSSDCIPIGRPLPGYRVSVLDSGLNPTPVGIAGELYISGIGLARGYLNQPGMTSVSFVADITSSASGARMYRTGDMARWRPDGVLEFLGRKDQQVKIRGFRVELGEIDATLKKHDEVQDTLTIAHEVAGHTRLATYVIPRVVRPSLPNEKNRITQWQRMHETDFWLGSETDGDFNTVGWNSSYTDGPIPEEEMRLWVLETVARIKSLQPSRILEIGCGTGLLLTRLAQTCETYTGMDFSKSTLQQLRAYLASRQDLNNVILRHGFAHELSFLKDDSVDLVIINSVIMYFPSIDYLMEVLSEAVRVTKPGGHIFVGDVRSLPLLYAFHASVQMHRAPDNMTLAALGMRVAQALYSENELVVDPQFFMELHQVWDKIGRMEVTPKSGAYDNELSRFRYDAILRIGKKESVAAPQRWIDWDSEGTWREQAQKLLSADPRLSLGVRRIRDQRSAPWMMAAELLQTGSDVASAEQLRQVCANRKGQDLNELLQFAKEFGIELSWQGIGSDGIINVILNPHWHSIDGTDKFSSDWYREYGNAPLLAESTPKLQNELLVFLSQCLPDYMRPSSITILPCWPLTVSGKINRAALPTPKLQQDSNYQAPRTLHEEVLCLIFAEVLQLERVGINDDFFALGGNSLIAMRLISRVATTLIVDLPVRLLFEAPTVAALAPRLQDIEKARPALMRAIKRPDRVPLSNAQQRLWFIDRLGGTSTQYNICEAFRLNGDLDVLALEGSIQTIVERHEVLRTRLVEVDGEPVQIIDPAVKMHLPVQDLSELNGVELEETIARIYESEWDEPFDLSQDLLFRAKILKVKSGEHVLIRSFHHIVMDAWSQGLINRELEFIYDALHRGHNPQLAPLAVQYADFTLWQREWLNKTRIDRDLKYWTHQLAGVPEELMLPRDRDRHLQQTFSAKICLKHFNPEETARLKDTSQENRVTLYMTLLAAFAALLQRYSGQDDIVIGSPTATRQDPQLEHVIGFFINTLAMRVRPNAAGSFRDLLAFVRRTTLEAFFHQDLPFEQLVAALPISRSLNRSPIFQIGFSLQNVPVDVLRMQGLEIEPITGNQRRARFDVEVEACVRDGQLEFRWVYNSDLFDHWRIEQMAGHYLNLLKSAIELPDFPLYELEILSNDEKLQLTKRKPSSSGNVPKATIAELFEAQAEQSPTAIAAVYGTKSLSYCELNRKANQLAHQLIAMGIGPEMLVGLCMDRSVEMIVGFMAIFKAGAAYLPLDPNHPQVRKQMLLNEAVPKAILSSSTASEHLPDVFPVIKLDQWLAEEHNERQAHNPTDAERTSILHPSHPAYVIYTSGTTGIPKGVIVTHEGIAALVKTQSKHLHISFRSRIMQCASLAFDASIWEMLMALANGATLVVLPDDKRNEVGFHETCEALGVTHATLTPALLRTVDDIAKLPIQVLIVAGEVCLEDLVSKWSPDRMMVNAYGPTETTICATISPPLKPSQLVTIGLSVLDSQTYVLDRWLQLTPIGVPGELYISGASVARGYLKRPGLTAERFVANPWGKTPGGRMYRTADLAQWRPDGTLEFIGRIDDQLKIRGFRIEPAEIEFALRSNSHVQACAVVGKERTGAFHPSDKHLVAYVIAKQGASASSVELQNYLKERLPDYMVPGHFIFVKQLPLTLSGKIDRAALGKQPIVSEDPKPCHALPETKMERMLVSLWKELLNREVGIHDNFFDVGGHSLLLARLHALLHKMNFADLTLVDLFVHPTISSLASYLTQNGVQSTRGTESVAASLNQGKARRKEQLRKRLQAR